MTKKLLYSFLLFTFLQTVGFGQTWTGTTSTAWNIATNWSTGVVPTAGSAVIIPNVVNKPIISVAGAVCASLTITSAGSVSNSLTINSPGTLTVSGAVSITSPTGGTNTTIINVATGTLTVGGSITMDNSANSNRDSSLRIGTGTITVSGNIVMSGSATMNDITFSGAGILNVGGTISGGALTPSTGTVNYNNAGAQTVGPYTYYNLTLSNSGVKTSTITSVTNNLTLTGTATSTTGANLAVGGNLDVGTGTTFTTGSSFSLAVTGTTSVSGTLALGGTAGKTFTGNATINNGGSWSEAGSGTVGYSGNLQNDGSFSVSTAVHTFSGAGKTISGANAVTIPSLTINGITTNNGNLTVSTALAGTSTLTNSASGVLNIGGTSGIDTFANAGTTTINGIGATGAIGTALAKFTNTGTLNLSGTGTITGITNNAGGTVNFASSGVITAFNNATGTSQLNITASTPSITTLTATAAGNTVDYLLSGAQTIKGTAYSNLTLSNSGTKTLGAATTTTGNLTVNSGIPFDMSTFLLTLNGNLINNGGTITGTTGGVTLGGTAAQNIAGFTTTGTVTMSKTGGTATFTGNVNGTSLTINGSGGTLNLGSGLTHTFTGNIALTNGTLNGGSSTLNANSTSASAWTGTGSNFISGTSTVIFGGVAQTITTATSFYNLILSGTGTKTFSATSTSTSNLSIASGVIANLGTFTHTASSLTLGGSTTPLGSWGSTTSAALNKNNTYFAATTGIVNVSTASCITPTVYAISGTSGNFCNNVTGTAIGLPNSESGVSYQLVRGITNLGSPIAGTGSAINFGNFNTTGVYTITATRSSTLCTAAMSGSITINTYSTPQVPTATVINVSCPSDNTGTITITNNPVQPASLAFTSTNNQNVDFGQTFLNNKAKFSIEGWMKFDPTQYSNRMSLFGQNDAIEVGFESNNLIGWTVNGGQVSYPVSLLPTDYAWHHIAVVGNGTNLIMYIDGVQVATGGSPTGNYGSSTYTAKIGAGVLDATAGGFTGEVFKLGFWDKDLSTTEITNLASGFVEYNTNQVGLLSGYNFTEGTGTTIAGAGSVAATGTFGTSTAAPIWKDPYTYSWTSTPAGFTSSLKNLTGLSPRTYNLTTTLKGCTGTGSWTVNATNSLPAGLSYGTSPAVYCLATAITSNNVTLTTAGTPAPTFSVSPALPAGLSLNTSTGSITGTPTAGAVAAGYTITATNSCGSTNTVLNITVNASPSGLSYGTSLAVYCAGTAITANNATLTRTGTPAPTFSVSPALPAGLSLNTSTGSITGTPTAGAVVAGYTITATNSCGSTNTSLNITVNDSPSGLSYGTSPAVYCLGTAITSNNITLTTAGTPAPTFSVSPALPAGLSLNTSTGSITGTPTAGAVAAGYTITATNSCGSTNTVLNITVNASPSGLSYGTSPAVYCAGTAITANNATLTRTGTPAPTFSVSPALPAGLSLNTSTGSITGTPTAGAVAAGYTITATNSCGSTNTSLNITVNDSPSGLSYGTSPAVYCLGTAITSNNITLTTAGTPAPTFSVSPALPAGLSLNTSTGSITGTPTAGAVAAGYTITATNSCGSTNTVLNITVNASPSGLSYGTSPAVYCLGTAITSNNITLTTAGTPAPTFSVSPALPAGLFLNTSTGSITGTPTAGAVAAGYTITATNSCGSTNTVLNITVTQLPVITTQPQALSLCIGQSGSFKVVPAAPAQSYQWEYSSDGISGWQITDTAAGVSGHSTTTLSLINVPLSYNGYYVRCVLTNGTCPVYTTPVQLTVNPLPTAPTASVTTQPTCAAPTATITVSSPVGGSGFEYSLDGTSYVSSAVFTGVSVGLHNITVKNTSTGCESAQTQINVAPSATKKWNGSVSTDWNTPANWTPNGVPTLTDCVEIPKTGNNPSIAKGSGNFNMHTLTVDYDSVLTVGSGSGTPNTITVTNGVTVSGPGPLPGSVAGALIFENATSLFQTNTASNINSGNITYKRDTQPVRRYDLTYWGSPVTATPGFTLKNLSPATLDDKYYSYNNTADKWVPEYRGEAVMMPGKGYNVRAPQTYAITGAGVIYTASFIGVPNNGDVPIPVVGANWSLSGNPYPSAVDATKFIGDNGTNVGTLYFWTHATNPSTAYPGVDKYNYNTDDYALFNLTGPAEAAPSTPGGTPSSGFIAAGQGFFFKPSVTGTVLFTNSMRKEDNNTQFFKTAQSNAVEKNRVWLNLTNDFGAFKQMLVGYISGATNIYDINYDAETTASNAFIDFYTINDSRKLTIQGRTVPFDDTEVLPIGYKSSIAGDFTIAIDHTDGLFTQQAVYLEDKTTGKIQNLTTGNYTFTTAIGTFAERFVLRYTNKTLGTGDIENLENTVLVSVKDKTIKVTSSKETIRDVVIYDVSGKLLYEKKKVETTEFQISTLQSSNQVLLVKVTLENDFTTTKKIIFK